MTERKRECRMKKNKEVTIEDMNSRELESLLKTELARDKKDYQQIHKILEQLKAESKQLPEVSQEEVDQVTLRLQKPQIVPSKTAPRATWKNRSPLWLLFFAWLSWRRLLCMAFRQCKR